MTDCKSADERKLIITSIYGGTGGVLEIMVVGLLEEERQGGVAFYSLTPPRKLRQRTGSIFYASTYYSVSGARSSTPVLFQVARLKNQPIKAKCILAKDNNDFKVVFPCAWVAYVG